jgi:subtilisin
MLVMILAIIIIPAPYSISYSELQTAQIKDAAIQASSNATGLIFGPKETKSTISPIEKVSAGPDRVVREGDKVILKAEIDSTSHLNFNIHWQQISPRKPIIPLFEISKKEIQFEAPDIAKFEKFEFLLTIVDDAGNKFSDTVKVKILPSISKGRNETEGGVAGQEFNTASQKNDNSSPIIDSSSKKNQGDKGQFSSPGITITSERDNNQFQRGTESEQLTKSKNKFTLPPAVSGSKLKKVQGIPINDQYIVVLKDGTPLSSISSLVSKSKSSGAQVPHVFTKILKGFTVRTPNLKLLDRISNLSDVSYIEPDLKVHKFSQTIPTGINRIDGDVSQTVSGDGQGSTNVDIAVLDTGIDLTHPDLNVFKQISFVDGVTSGQDGDGHGTHVSGIAAAKDNTVGVVGVAPGARLWAVKVLDDNGGGSISSAIDGIEYVTDHADEIDAVNISFGCACHSDALDTAIHNSIAAGITYVVAAGNDGTDASGTSPANHPDVIAVSAIVDTDGKCGGLGSSSSYGKDDYFASFSNYGSKVDMAAPGVSIYSTWKGSSYAYATGTSMSAPHVTGAVALYKANHVGASPSQVKSALLASGSTKSTQCNNNNNGHGYFQGDPDSAPEPLLYVGTENINQIKYHYSPSLILSGSNFLDVPSSSSLQLSRFSVAAWFKTGRDYSTDALIVNKGGFGSENLGHNMNFAIYMTKYEQIRAGFETTSGTNYFISSLNKYSDGTWHQAVVTYDGSALVLYIDGVKIGSKTTSGALPDKSGAQPVRIGANSQALNSFFQGNIDEVRIWKKRISPTEVLNTYNGSPYTTDQVLYLPFN